MSERDTSSQGAPCWVDLFTSDPDKSTAFYGELFGWTAAEPSGEHGGYINLSKDGKLVAGCMQNDGESGTPDAWTTYLATPDAQATVEAATAHGGQVVVPALEVGNLGTMAVMIDPGNAAIGAWRAGEHQGFGIANQPGAPAWFELQTRDYDASVAFYRDVFQWDIHVEADTPEFRYTTFREGDAALAGIMDASGFLPEGTPASWGVYFSTDDADKTLAQVGELGGSIVMPAEDTPYGRLATATDPTGAVFKIVASI
ncbi:MAG TPA: VOC family protein [Acidimicrobiales bacterium]|jgi:predicted enzyme related to lactoylglutathione lyase|nr:VOC family protein [Acidimicrobiales bacterium]